MYDVASDIHIQVSVSVSVRVRFRVSIRTGLRFSFSFGFRVILWFRIRHLWYRNARFRVRCRERYPHSG